MANFSIQVGEWAAKTKGKMHTIVKKIIVDMSTRIVERSPVKTGRFRANWQYATLESGVPSTPRHADIDPTGQFTVARISSQIDPEPAGKIHVLVNNLPYAIPLERGSSQQAPYGMVGITVLEFEAIVDGAATEVRDL